ncbi:uncharacterized protein [Cardiocondyla obscurior]|uniref:uncharacterized protein n=1 Tax=Cardiocondyla obscurior TaxID=286306 RepID=UPI0039657EF3
MRLSYLFLVWGLLVSVFGKTIMSDPNSNELLNELNLIEKSSNEEPKTSSRSARCNGNSGLGSIGGLSGALSSLTGSGLHSVTSSGSMISNLIRTMSQLGMNVYRVFMFFNPMNIIYRMIRSGLNLFLKGVPGMGSISIGI